MTSFAEVVGVRVHHHRSADDRRLSAQLDEVELVHAVVLRTAPLADEVPHVPHVPLRVPEVPVRLPRRVVVAAGRDAALEEVAELVDVEAVQAVLEALD